MSSAINKPNVIASGAQARIVSKIMGNMFFAFHFVMQSQCNQNAIKRKQKIYIIIEKFCFCILPAASSAAINQFNAAIKMQS